jgi:ribonucleoside-diphosphate reductase subunit M2
MSDAKLSALISEIVDLQRKGESEEDRAKRYSLFPILDEDAYRYFSEHETLHWSDTELDYEMDIKWYNTATPEIRRFIDTIIGFFLSGDGVISENIIYRFLLESKTYEDKAMFISQLHRELMHASTYGMMAISFKRTDQEVAKLVIEAEKTECTKKKISFMEKWMLSDLPLYQRLVAFACAEGIFFCNLFAAAFWLKTINQFENFVFANSLIKKDESLHRSFCSWLFRKEVARILQPLGEEERKTMLAQIKAEVHVIIMDAVAIEDLFTDYILENPLLDLNAPDLKIYTRVITDNLLVELSFEPVFHVKNKFAWLDAICMEQKGNFYEVNIGEYRKRSLADVLNWRKRAGLVAEQHDVYNNPEDVDF